MKWRRTLTAVIMALSMASFGVIVPQAQAAASCHGASCNGLEPMGRCDGDAQTVGAMHVKDGMLELRYSPYCVANWSRFTPYARSGNWSIATQTAIYARVTVWNPGAASYGVAHSTDVNPFASSWSFMTDGTKTACTGVEVVYVSKNANYDSQGWYWGPCR